MPCMAWANHKGWVTDDRAIPAKSEPHGFGQKAEFCVCLLRLNPQTGSSPADFGRPQIGGAGSAQHEAGFLAQVYKSPACRILGWHAARHKPNAESCQTLDAAHMEVRVRLGKRPLLKTNLVAAFLFAWPFRACNLGAGS